MTYVPGRMYRIGLPSRSIPDTKTFPVFPFSYTDAPVMLSAWNLTRHSSVSNSMLFAFSKFQFLAAKYLRAESGRDSVMHFDSKISTSQNVIFSNLACAMCSRCKTTSELQCKDWIFQSLVEERQ